MARTLPTLTPDQLDRVRFESPESSRLGFRRRWSLLARLDQWAIALLVAVPVLIYVPPALFGRPLMGADELNQNYPLRELSGELLRHGRLPLWDPYIWSGTPLLAGWNAGSLYPGTWLFAVMPGIWAYTINFLAIWVVCGLGMHVFLRRLGCSPLASLLGALTFTYIGFMPGQIPHFGLLTGMSFTPWMLLAVHELAKLPAPREARRWTALLGGCGGLVVLTGEPRAVSSVGIIVGVYVLAVCWRARRHADRWTRVAGAGVGSIFLAMGLGAVQWLPGLSFLRESERGANTFIRFAEGSLSWHDLELLFVPFIVGGNGNFGLPRYAGSLNLPELSFAVGILPLVAAFALAWRAIGRRPSPTPLGVWYALIVAGAILSAGSNTPLGHVLEAVPLYGGQRLQNRNAVLVDFALAVLLAVFIDVLGSDRTSRDPTGEKAGSVTGLEQRERWAGLVPVAVVAFLVFAAYVLGRWIQRSMGVSSYMPRLAAGLTPYFVVTLVISAGAAFLLIAAPRLGAGGRRRLATIVVAADVLFSLADASYTTPSAATLARENAPVTVLSKLLGANGRYAIFNPAQSLPPAYRAVIRELGPYDLGILHHLYSVQGYASVVGGRYQDATGSHQVENLQPAALTTSTFDILNLRDLITLPEYLVSEIPGNRPIPVAQGSPVAPGTEAAAEALDAIAPQKPLPSLPPFLLSLGASSTWMLPGPIALDAVTIVLLPYDDELPGTITVGILNARNQVVGTQQVTVVGSQAELALNGRYAYGIQLAAPSGTPVAIGAVAVTTVHPVQVNSGPFTRRLALNQILQGVLEPPRWRYETEIGGLPVFTNTLARGPAWVEAAGSATPTMPTLASTHTVTPSVEPWQNPVTVVSTPEPAVLVRSEAYENGWIARIAPASGAPAVTVHVRRIGLIQAISIPAGKFVVTWVYTSKRTKIGLLVSGASVLVLLLLLFTPRRRRKSGYRPALAGAPAAGSPPLTGSPVETGSRRDREPNATGPPLSADAGLTRREGAPTALRAAARLSMARTRLRGRRVLADEDAPETLAVAPVTVQVVTPEESRDEVGTQQGTADRSRMLFATAILVVAVPFLVACIELLAHRGPIYLIADPALVEVDVREALRWHQLLGPYDRYGWHHPGPALAYVLATIDRIVGAGSVGDCVGIATINASAALATIVLVRRRAGDLPGLWTAALLALLCFRVGPPNLLAPWGPDVLALPAIFLGVLCANAARRSLVSLMGALVVATFLVQTQLATLPIALGMILVALVLAAIHSRAGKPASLSRNGTIAVGLLSLLLAVAWLPPVLEQIQRMGHSARPTVVSALHPLLPQVDPSQGNFVAIWRFFTTAHVGHGVISVFSLLVPQPAVFVLLLAAIATAVAFGRRSSAGFGTDLGIVAAVAGVATLLAITEIVGPIQWFDLTWDKAVAVLAGIAAGVSLLGRLQDHAMADDPHDAAPAVPASPSSPATPTSPPGQARLWPAFTGTVIGAGARLAKGAGTASVVVVFVAATTAGACFFFRISTFQVKYLSAPALGATWRDIGPQLQEKKSVFLMPLNRFAYGVTAGLTDQLVARGVQVTVPARWAPQFGIGRVTTGHEQIKVMIAVGRYSGGQRLLTVPGAPSVRLKVVDRHELGP